MRGIGLNRLKPLLKRTLPPAAWTWLRRVARRPAAPVPAPWPAPGPPPPPNIYEALYETHGKLFSDEDVVGAGDFDLIGRIELGVLLMEGLRPTDTLVDFGCGTGRLAVHAIPRLVGGHYIGVDISQSMLDKAQTRIRWSIPKPCRVSWIKQTAAAFPFEDRSVDMICAFSVFTHIEHEDTYRYLKDALRVIRPGGRFIFSCLPLSLPAAEAVFLESARDDLESRWRKVRNVTTSMELMEAIARLAGWTRLRWYAGNERTIRLPDTGEPTALGQSTCVLEAPRLTGPASPEVSRIACAPDEVGRIELRWDDTSLVLVPHLTGPLEGEGGRFHVFPSEDPQTTGPLTAPPFAALKPALDERTSTITVSRLVSGVYRYTVAVRNASDDAAGALSQSGATVQVFSREDPRPMVFRVPHGEGLRWTVFDVLVDGRLVSLRPVNTLEGAADAQATEAWSPPPSGTPDPAFDPDQRCPLCEREVAFDPIIQKHIYQYRRCQECGVLYAIPRPSPPELLRRLTFWAESAPRLTPAEQEAALRVVEHRFAWIRRYRPGARTILDIGAGAGAFLAAARRAGFDALGVELVPNTARFPGAEILVGVLASLNLPRSYDVITLWDALEHLMDPLGMLRRAFTLLKADGILMIETPNERGISARLRGADWWVFGPTDHLVMFSPETLSDLVRKADGRVVYMETRELCSWNDPGNTRPLPWRGRLVERARATRGVRPVLRALGLGDWVFMIARPARGEQATGGIDAGAV